MNTTTTSTVVGKLGFLIVGRLRKLDSIPGKHVNISLVRNVQTSSYVHSATGL